VLDGLFKLAHRLFGIDIVAADGEVQVWNGDVRFFKVKDASTGQHIASFYLDPYSRPENKRVRAPHAPYGRREVCWGLSVVV
jgi:oligopeptidase A